MKFRFRIIALLSMMLLLNVFAQQSFGQTSKEANVKWATFNDPRFDFTIEYPAEWSVIPRNDTDPKAMSGVLTFSPITQNKIDTQDTTFPEIVVGLYLAEVEPDQSLTEWTDLYQEISSPFSLEEIVTTQKRPLMVAGRDAVFQEGSSPLTDYEFINVKNGKTVWFIWTNDISYPDIYDHMVKSFKLGNNTPVTLQEVYGQDFQPLHLERKTSSQTILQPEKPTRRVPGLASPLLSVISLPSPASNWKVPNAGGPYSINCGSSYHVGPAQYAADIAVGTGTNVYASYRGWVDFAGWDTTGYGNLIRMSTDNIFSRVYTSYYAHLQNIYVSPGQYIGTLGYIAKSGNTGGVPAHLHFHIRSSSDAVNLTGMYGFYPNSHYPGDYQYCGYTQR